MRLLLVARNAIRKRDGARSGNTKVSFSKLASGSTRRVTRAATATTIVEPANIAAHHTSAPATSEGRRYTRAARIEASTPVATGTARTMACTRAARYVREAQRCFAESSAVALGAVPVTEVRSAFGA